MKMHLKFDNSIACMVILQEYLAQFDISCTMSGMGVVDLDRDLSLEQYKMLESDLKKYGIEFIENSKSALVQQIKDAIREYVFYPDKHSHIKLSTWISGKMNLSYSYLSRTFSEETYTSIENYMINERIERVKQMMAFDLMTFTEIAWKLNYSSVAHLSNQFKKVTGITPTLFQKMMKKNSISNYGKSRNVVVKMG